jgi:predicted HTH transcriptional regulator
MAEKKMTLRQYYNTILTLVADNEELTAMTQERIKQLDRKTGNSEKEKRAIENKSLKEQVMEFLTPNTTHRASNVAQELNISQSKASYLLNSLVTDGLVTKTITGGTSYFSVKES